MQRQEGLLWTAKKLKKTYENRLPLEDKQEVLRLHAATTVELLNIKGDAFMILAFCLINGT
jgi:hypothetical protein